MFISFFGIYSCVDVHSRQQEKSFGQEVYEEVINEVEKKVLSDEWMEKRMKTGWYKGHEYLIYVYGHSIGLTHNPDCPCKNEK